MQQQGLDIDKLRQVVKTRWLKPQEVLKILQNHELFTVSHKPPQKPQSGSWFLFNRRVLRNFRSDGFEWQKKKNGKTINEAHECLKVDNVNVLHCYYARGDKNPTFQRRIYWMLDPPYEHIVLVHYRDVLQGSISVSARNDSSISNQKASASRAEVHSSPGWTSELIVQCPNSCSLGSAEEVSSQTCASESHWIQHKAALQKLKMQLRLEDKEDCDVNAEEVPANNESIILPGIQNEEPDTSMNYDDNFDVLDFSEDHINETGTHPCPSAIDVLKNSDTWLEEDQLEAILHPACMTLTENQWFKIHEVSPESAFSSESTKVIIVGDFLCNPPHSSWEVLFGDVKVPVEIIQRGVIRCHTPCLNAGKVRMCLIDGNGKSCSEAREFEFLEKPTKGMIDGNRNPCKEARDSKIHQIPTKSSDELSLLLHYVQTLFDGHACGLFSNFSSPLPDLGCEFQINQMDIKKKMYEQLDPENTVNSVMEALLNDKFKQWLSSKCEQNIDGDHLLPKQYHTIIHMIAALGYDLALKPLLSSGVPINYRDANGWTALHWAARFGREDMVVALLTAGAAAGALSHPTSEDPAAKTPASIALAYGFKGLSALLSEAQLTTYLDSIELKENAKLDSMEGGVCRAVDRISDKSSHVHGRTDDQLALKDSLGAVRNAVQAAGRIQAAFRIFSFKKKKEMALQNRNSCYLFISETGAVSHSMLEKAALSIQKNFRCWKKRKELLKIRNNIVRIQARVRAHQERKKYKELISSVGVLEKVMIRWYRKGVGLHDDSGAMPIDEDVAKVFRKLRVETAIDEAVSRVSCIIGRPKAMQQYRRMLKRYQQAKVEVEEPYSTPYKDVMAWFAMGKQRQKGLGHTCMKQAGHKLLGRDDIRQKLMENILLDRNVGSDCTVICISGGSGFGKTSLLHVLYNDQELIDAFDKRIWIQISGKLDILILFRKIIEFAMNDHCSIMNIDLLRELVMEEITDKKFLLFLDDADIQDQQCWTSILEVLNAGAKDSAVVIATSSTNDVLRDVATHSYFLNPLPEESNMSILQQYSGVGTDIQSNPDLVMIAKRFISRFGSNPLNLKSICGLLCHADTISLDKEKFEGSVMPLQLCHDVLPSHLKKCLAFCSLFPEGYIFDKHHTVRQWISHGCVRTLEGYGLEDVGLEYFSELLCRSFFQPSPIHNDKDHKFVMHELMYKVVESVGRNRYFKSENPVSSVPKNTLHLSFVASQFQTVKLMSITEELKDLQTFLVVQPEWKAYNISFPTLNLVGLDEFFLKFTSLETLDLSHTDIEELPGSIVGLRNLRYLSVNSTNVRALPSELCSLSNLQTLEAKHCRFLTELPGDIKKLVKLRHLDLTKELGYVHLPCGIGELTELQTLPVFHVSGDLSCCSISELGTLHNLRGRLWLSGLESEKTSSKAQEASLKDKHRLKDLTLQWHDDGIDIEDEDVNEDAENVADEQVLESLQPHASLQVLTIRGYEGSRFPAWMQGSSSSLPNLVTLTLDSCCNCTEFPAIAQLPWLKSLSVRKMYDVRWLSSNPHGDGAAKFLSLELLNLWEMYGLEELFFEESEGDCPRLRKVCISRCPYLKRLPRAPVTELVLHCGHQFPDISELVSLVSLKIEGFHGTKSFRLPPAAALRKLEIKSCNELSSVDGLSALTTVWRLKIARCPKLVLPGTSSKYRRQPRGVAGKEVAVDGLQSFTKKRGPGDGADAVEKDGLVLKKSKRVGVLGEELVQSVDDVELADQLRESI